MNLTQTDVWQRVGKSSHQGIPPPQDVKSGRGLSDSIAIEGVAWGLAEGLDEGDVEQYLMGALRELGCAASIVTVKRE